MSEMQAELTIAALAAKVQEELLAIHTGRNRIEIVSWRELFDDEDSLNMQVFAAGDMTAQADVIIATESEETEGGTTLCFDYDSPEGVEHPCTMTNDLAIKDGDILTSHDGRRFRVSIEEVK